MVPAWMIDPSLMPADSVSVDFACEGCGQLCIFRYPPGVKRLPKVPCTFCGHRQRPPKRRRRPFAAPASAHPVMGHPFGGERPKLVRSPVSSALGLIAGVCVAVLLISLTPFPRVLAEGMRSLEEKAKEVRTEK